MILEASQYLPSYYDNNEKRYTNISNVLVHHADEYAQDHHCDLYLHPYSMQEWLSASRLHETKLSKTIPHITADDLKGFQAKTLEARMHAMIDDVIRYECDVLDNTAKKALHKLKSNIPNGYLANELDSKELFVQQPHWRRHYYDWKRWLRSQPHGITQQHAAPSIVAEMYVYRQILDATGYFGRGNVLHDPYHGQKVIAMKVSEPILMGLQQALVNAGTDAGYEYSKLFTQMSVWGNQMDLSGDFGDRELMTTSISQLNIKGHDMVGHIRNIIGQAHPRLLNDDTEKIIKHLSNVPERSRRVDIVLDNFGIEFASDLCLAVYLLQSSLASEIRIHTKDHPILVSDVTWHDADCMMQWISRNSNLSVLAQKLKTAVDDGKLRFATHELWTLPRLFGEMPMSLASDLSKSALVIFKGDANFRRLVNDLQFPVDTSFSSAVSYMPFNVAALRTIKSEIAFGMGSEAASRAAAVDKNWSINGKWGCIFFGH